MSSLDKLLASLPDLPDDPFDKAVAAIVDGTEMADALDKQVALMASSPSGEHDYHSRTLMTRAAELLREQEAEIEYKRSAYPEEDR